MTNPTDAPTFHTALRELLQTHGIDAQLGPRRSAEGAPMDDIEGLQDGELRVKVTTVTQYFMHPKAVQRQAWFAALMGLPGVLPYPEVFENGLGGATVWIRWLDHTPLRPRNPA